LGKTNLKYEKMKKILLMLVFLPSMLLGQTDIETIQNQIKDLEESVKLQTVELSKLKSTLKELELKKSIENKGKSFNVSTKTIKSGYLFSEAYALADKLIKIPAHVSITVNKFHDTNWWVVTYGDKTGYMLDYCFEVTTEVEKIRKGTMPAYEFANFEREQKQKTASAAKEKQRKERILREYGKVEGEKVLKGVVWIGMSDSQAYDSWGAPKDINRTTSAYGKKEQWVYDNNQYLYFKDGKLTTIQN